jgi:hypothetical protein
MKCKCYQQIYQALTDADIAGGEINCLIGFNMELVSLNDAQIKTDTDTESINGVESDPSITIRHVTWKVNVFWRRQCVHDKTQTLRHFT